MDRDLGAGKYSQVKVNDLDIEYMLGNKDTPSNPFILENYDIVNVVAPIRANFQPVVSVQGEVKFPRNVHTRDGSNNYWFANRSGRRT